MIQKLKLGNFKCFEELDLDLGSLTLITGVNGMGKSSVIQSMLLLRQSYDERYLQAENKVLLTGELVNLISGNAIRYALSESPYITIMLDGDRFSTTIKSDSRSDLLECTTAGLENIPGISLFSDSLQYIGAERQGPRQKYLRTKTIKHKGRLGSGAGELTAAFLFSCIQNGTSIPIPELKHPNESSNLIYANVSAWLGEIAYDGAEITATETAPEEIELSYSFKKGKLKGYDFSPLNVGFGFSYVLPVILAVLSATPGSLILVENPEAHLHPKGQLRIGKLLALAAKNGVQVIVESHSDHLLNGVRLAVKSNLISENAVKLAFFNSDKKIGREQPVIESNGRISNWPEDFFDTWEYSLMELL